MKKLKALFDKNKAWVEKRLEQDPNFYTDLAKVQEPQFLWIGCSDSRVPATEVVDLQPGELFVHRNLANLVVHSDFNCLSVLQYSVDILKVKDIIVCGHYGCGGVKAAIETHEYGLAENWFRYILDVYHQHKAEIDLIEGEEARYDRLVELNAIQQVKNICHTTIVQSAWDKGQEINVHGWVYDLDNRK